MRPEVVVDIRRGEPRLARHVEHHALPRARDKPAAQSPPGVVPSASKHVCGSALDDSVGRIFTQHSQLRKRQRDRERGKQCVSGL
jgi:hypothetical protein